MVYQGTLNAMPSPRKKMFVRVKTLYAVTNRTNTAWTVSFFVALYRLRNIRKKNAKTATNITNGINPFPIMGDNDTEKPCPPNSQSSISISSGVANRAITADAIAVLRPALEANQIPLVSVS